MQSDFWKIKFKNSILKHQHPLSDPLQRSKSSQHKYFFLSKQKAEKFLLKIAQALSHKRRNLKNVFDLSRRPEKWTKIKKWKSK